MTFQMNVLQKLRWKTRVWPTLPSSAKPNRDRREVSLDDVECDFEFQTLNGSLTVLATTAGLNTEFGDK